MNAPGGNIASHLTAMARRTPHALAVAAPHGRDRRNKTAYVHYSYAQLERWSNELAHGLTAIGIGRGTRTVLMLRPGPEFFACTFALFKTGAVPVMVDPGMGLKHLGRCLAQAEPTAFVGVPKAHVARVLFGWARSSVRINVTSGPRLGMTATLTELAATGQSAGVADFATVEPETGETAAILFTSGSTGPPKGAVYTHAHFQAQVAALRQDFGIQPGEVDLCTFPLFALFAPALGMSSVVPDMDPTRPAFADPKKIIGAIEDFGVTNLFGSPALLRGVGTWGAAQGVKLTSLRRVISSGAPVPAAVIERFTTLMPAGAQVFTGYGATEALPVAALGSDEILRETRQGTDQGRGVCVGRSVGGTRIQIVPISDEPIPEWCDDLELPCGQVGEITVHGPVVTREYFRLEQHTALGKIRAADGTIRHRMGDLGYMDDQGRLWFCGRKSQRVRCAEAPDGVLFTIPCEAIFNTHPEVFRSALVGVLRSGKVEPVICIERAPERATQSDAALVAALLARAADFAHTRVIRTVLVHPGFPVDIRHNAKIGREQLALWAAQRLQGQTP